MQCSLLQVNLSSGHVVRRLSHPKLMFPRQLAVDDHGSLYVASTVDRSVLVHTAKGTWQCLLMADNDVDPVSALSL